MLAEGGEARWWAALPGSERAAIAAPVLDFAYRGLVRAPAGARPADDTRTMAGLA
jgi:hypothetical protein